MIREVLYIVIVVQILNYFLNLRKSFSFKLNWQVDVMSIVVSRHPCREKTDRRFHNTLFYRDICNPIRSVYFHYYLFFEKDSEFSFSETKWENLVWKIFELAKLWEESNSLLNLTDLIFENSLILRKEEIKKQRWTNCTLANKNEHWKKFFMLRYIGV